MLISARCGLGYRWAAGCREFDTQPFQSLANTVFFRRSLSSSTYPQIYHHRLPREISALPRPKNVLQPTAVIHRIHTRFGDLNVDWSALTLCFTGAPLWQASKQTIQLDELRDSAQQRTIICLGHRILALLWLSLSGDGLWFCYEQRFTTIESPS